MDFPLIGVTMFTVSAISAVLCFGSWLRGRSSARDAIAPALVGIGGMILSIGFGGIGAVSGSVDTVATTTGMVTMFVASIAVVKRHQKARSERAQ